MFCLVAQVEELRVLEEYFVGLVDVVHDREQLVQQDALDVEEAHEVLVLGRLLVVDVLLLDYVGAQVVNLLHLFKNHGLVLLGLHHVLLLYRCRSDDLVLTVSLYLTLLDFGDELLNSVLYSRNAVIDELLLIGRNVEKRVWR